MAPLNGYIHLPIKKRKYIITQFTISRATSILYTLYGQQINTLAKCYTKTNVLKAPWGGILPVFIFITVTTFRPGRIHFYRDCSSCKYFFLHLDQNLFITCWTLRHNFREWASFRWNMPGGGRTTLLFIIRMWFGVRGSGTSGSFKFNVVRGR